MHTQRNTDIIPKPTKTLQVAEFLFITEHILAVPAIINNHKKMSQKTSNNTCHKKDVNGSMHQPKTSQFQIQQHGKSQHKLIQ
jgi:hypothetical protein